MFSLLISSLYHCDFPEHIHSKGVVGEEADCYSLHFPRQKSQSKQGRLLPHHCFTEGEKLGGGGPCNCAPESAACRLFFKPSLDSDGEEPRSQERAVSGRSGLVSWCAPDLAKQSRVRVWGTLSMEWEAIRATRLSALISVAAEQW